jgi:hypothetical protein
LIFNGLHDVISQKIELSTTNAERIINPTQCSSIGRLLIAMFDDSGSYGSRRPDSAAPYPSFSGAGTKAPFHASKAVIATCFMLVSCLAYFLTLKMEVACSSKMLVDN